MVNLIAPHYQRRRFFRPHKPWDVWGTMRRNQLLELVALSGAIAFVWLGAHIDNQRSPWAKSEPAGLESASVELKIDLPPGYKSSQRRPL